jgi:hypothetical protein
MSESINEPTLTVLGEAMAKAEAINHPRYLGEFLAANPAEREMDDANGARRIRGKAIALSKPAVCLLGPYSSGKTFLLNYFLGDERFVSKMEPTTAVITVIRHIGDKPAEWPAKHNVFTLRSDADLRTLDLACTTGAFDYEDLPGLTTYPEALRHEAVIVFIDKDVLRRCTFYDCPGVGTMAESAHEGTNPDVDPTLTQKQRESIRERELQVKAISNADGYMLLSSVTGNAGCFSDANTANILYSIARNMARFPTETPHGNLLFVGSQADPAKAGLEDETIVLRKLQVAIQKQVELVPREQRQKFDLFELKKRIVLFFGLDRREQQLELRRASMDYKRAHPNADPLEVERAARARFEEDRPMLERTAAFDKELGGLVDQLVHGMQEYRSQASAELLGISIAHHDSKRTRYQSHMAYKHQYEVLSARYDRERDAREKDWKSIAASLEADVDRAAGATIREIEKTIDYWCVKDNVYQLLKDEFSDDKTRAREFAANVVSDRIKEEFGESIQRYAVRPEAETHVRLVAFDKRWLERQDSDNEIGRNARAQVEVGQFSVPFVDTVSVAQTFTAATAALAGGTTLLAVGGSALAQAAVVKVLAIGVTMLGTVGLGGAAAGALAAIPVYGWVIAGVAGVGMLLWRVFAWRESLASAISKSLKKERDNAVSAGRRTVNEIFGEIKALGRDSLARTKAILDGHICEVHEIGKGKVTASDLGQAMTYYESQAAVLQEARTRIAVDAAKKARP